MACRNCVTTEATLAFDFEGFGSVVINDGWDEDGTAITFSAVEDGRDKKMRENGDIETAGTNTRFTEVTARLLCTDEVLRLYNAWTSSNIDVRNQLNCGSGVFSDNCCKDETWRTVTINSFKRRDVDSSVSYFELEFTGLY